MSTAMVRKQIYIPRRQQTLIKRISETRGVSEGEVIRQAIEREINREWPGTTLEASAAWDQLMRFVEERKQAAGTGEPYQWNREEIYEERAGRWVHTAQE